MVLWRRLQLAIAFAIATFPALATSVAAQGGEAFYRNRTVNILVGSTPGGYYDIGSRVVARHLGQFIPGKPVFAVQNQPGAAGMALGNRMANTVERDGGTIAAMNRGLPQLALLGDPNVAFDPLQLIWLGSITDYRDDAYLLVVNAAHPVKAMADMKPPAKPVHLGGTRGGSTNITFALMARDLLGLNIDVVRGFPGAAQIWLAMERGEIDGQVVDISAIMVGRPQLWQARQLRPIVAFGRKERLPDYPDVPIARELITREDDRALLEFAEMPFFIAFPFAAPPGVPPERAKLLKDGFMAMMSSAAFREEIKKAGIIASPIDGDAVLDVIRRSAQTPQEVRARFARLLAD